MAVKYIATKVGGIDADLTGNVAGSELTSNKENTTIDTSTTKYPTVNLLNTGLGTKQATLVSQTNIKSLSINAGTQYSLLGSGNLDITVSGGGDSITASNGLTRAGDDIKLGGRTTEAMTIVSVGSPVDNPIGGTALVFTDTATRPTITVGAFSDDFSFLTGSEVVNFNTINTQIAQIGIFDQASSSDLDDTKLYFVNANGVKSAYLIGMQEDLIAEDIVILDSTTKQIKTIPKTALTGYFGTATLASGTVTVSEIRVKTGDIIFVTVNTPSGTLGFLSASTADIVDGTSFVINSSSALDNSTVNWWIKTP